MSDQLLESLNEVAYGHFQYWWSESLPRYSPDADVTAMWQSYPFGALTVETDWARWPLERVAALGATMASELQCDGLVIAESRQGVAVLTWPNKPDQPMILMIAYPGASGVTKVRAAPVCAKRFLSVKGFCNADSVVACAVTRQTALAVSVDSSMNAIHSWRSTRSKVHHSALVASSERTRNNSQRP